MVHRLSIPIIQFNPDYDRLILTIDSILRQEGIEYEMIISDDGSDKDYFNELKCYFERKGINNYRFIKSKINNGTVQNCLRALSECKYEVIKPISPGDFFFGTKRLCHWIDSLYEKNTEWSISDVLCYKKEGSFFYLESHPCRPYDIEVYKKEEWKKIRYNYIFKNDIAYGSAMLIKKNLFIRYLEEISSEVVYAEDNAFRLMACDEILPSYYPVTTIMYEWGEGVSTSNNPNWNEKLSKDWNYTTNILNKHLEKRAEYDNWNNRITYPSNNVIKKRMTSIIPDKNELDDYDYQELCRNKIYEILSKSGGKKIYIYGAGRAGSIGFNVFKEHMEIEGFIDRRYKELEMVHGIKVNCVDYLDLRSIYIIICLIEDDKSVLYELQRQGAKRENIFYISAIKGYIAQDIFSVI